jgi:hypothetical protein
MHKSNTNRGERSFGFEWFLLGEYPLSLFLPFGEKGQLGAASLLSQTIQECGLPVECVQSIARIMNNILVQTHTQTRTRRENSPGRIRIFCQKMMMGWEKKGGWGYFLIEQSRKSPSSECIEPLYDFFIYEEGD